MHAKRLAVEGKYFSEARFLKFNVITTRKVVDYLRSGGRYAQDNLLRKLQHGEVTASIVAEEYHKFDSVRIGISDICGLYSDKQRIVILYQFPRPKISSDDLDAFQQMNQLKQKYKDQRTLLLGVSHLHPSFLRRLQIAMNDQLFPPTKPMMSKNKQGQKTISDVSEETGEAKKDDDSFEVLLAADHDFDLFKNLRFQPT